MIPKMFVTDTLKNSPTCLLSTSSEIGNYNVASKQNAIRETWQKRLFKPKADEEQDNGLNYTQ